MERVPCWSWIYEQRVRLHSYAWGWTSLKVAIDWYSMQYVWLRSYSHPHHTCAVQTIHYYGDGDGDVDSALIFDGCMYGTDVMLDRGRTARTFIVIVACAVDLIWNCVLLLGVLHDETAAVLTQDKQRVRLYCLLRVSNRIWRWCHWLVLDAVYMRPSSCAILKGVTD